MRRKAERIPGVLRFRILSNFTDKQLQLIGSVAIAYNGCEHILHNMTGDCIQYPLDRRIITTRINGTEGLVAIISEACASYSCLAKTDIEAIAVTLKGEGFSGQKGYRDAAIHAMPYNVLAGIGRFTKRQAARYDVLITESETEAARSETSQDADRFRRDLALRLQRLHQARDA